MIAKEFEDFLIAHVETFLTPAEELAIFIDTHNTDHVMLLMASNGYSRVPVLTKEKKYVGTISMSDIFKYQAKQELSDQEMAGLDIGLMVNTKIIPVNRESTLTEIMHRSVDYPFLPIVDDDGTFLGIITRKSVMKAINSLLHDFTKEYTITRHDRLD